eukprot:CAMPEP_0174355058 /NCGR_PEP_ID=MMETSP0811_2-20130205/23085_1 /TAXON_ID=73025 ORGANISM="Eutreptiella gymnastica-like, Strain CCMP1594" /NCGR_SAMPLE_ID=MMETSP0811_2 /ASSEMBLY_ACC=CAM_ASM_000667 /LENGTH=104 /DNA_ID=CAMNT_0015486231 /DNA_START=192 /DNA_END=503 /DNA_ORIENTATION=+
MCLSSCQQRTQRSRVIQLVHGPTGVRRPKVVPFFPNGEPKTPSEAWPVKLTNPSQCPGLLPMLETDSDPTITWSSGLVYGASCPLWDPGTVTRARREGHAVCET